MQEEAKLLVAIPAKFITPTSVPDHCCDSLLLRWRWCWCCWCATHAAAAAAAAALLLLLLVLVLLLLVVTMQEEAKLLVATPAKFKSWFNVDVHESTEVTQIDRDVRCWCPWTFDDVDNVD
jgi:hypothetical protein